MNRVLGRFLSLAVILAVLFLLLRSWLPRTRPPVASSGTVATPAAHPTVGPSPTPSVSASVTNQSAVRQFDPGVNPYAAALLEPGRSHRAWDPNFVQQYQAAQSGDAIRFELSDGRVAVGTIRILQRPDGVLNYFSGELTAPEPGKFFFLVPPEAGIAGKVVGVVEFPATKTAYRIEPTGTAGAPELWQRRLDEVVCLNMPLAEAGALTNQTADLPPLRPDLGAGPIPAYNTNLANKPLISLQSLPGSPAVLLLDFFGGYTPTWGGVSYPAPSVGNDQIRDVWKRVAEDYMPFNINVTTDLKVYQAAPATSRQRCVFTTSTSAIGSGAAGVAYIGSWNWGSDTVCWSIYTTGKSAAEVGAHEPGHTLGLGHQTQDIPGQAHNDYFSGQGTGATGWAPIMGVGYYQPLSTWAKGEYQYAGNLNDALATIVGNNNVHYRTDDTGPVLANARYLEIYPDFSAMAEGVIETTGDTDAFQFTTSGGRVALTANPVNDWADLAVAVTLADASDTVIASNHPQTIIGASITTNLPAGTYTFRVIGAGRNDPLTSGFSPYASLGYYSVVGAVEGGRLPTRLSTLEHVPNGTAVGTVPANNPADSLSYAITRGNTSGTFAIDASGLVTVANPAALDYQRLATNTTLAVCYELFVDITDLTDNSQSETGRRVVISVLSTNLNYPVAFSGYNASAMVPYNATPDLPMATSLDIPNNFAFYQAGLNLNPQVGGTGGGQGLPANGVVFSPVDGTTFQLGPYGASNALLLGNIYARYGTFTLTTPSPYNSLAILACSANGGGFGSVVLNFTNGAKSQTFSLNAQDWYNTVTNVGAQGFGRVRLGQSTLNTEYPGWNNPNLYQTTLNLAALGVNQSIASITFTNPNNGGNMVSGIFALSGSVMPAEVRITQQPVSATNSVPTSGVTYSVTAMGTPPLGYQWYYSATGGAGTFARIDGQTSSNLVLAAVLQTNDAGSYRVVVTNSTTSATSTVATLTLFREPVITRQPSPTNLALLLGRSTTFSVAANAASPLTYYWRTNTTIFASGSSSNLTLSNLQLTNSGNYAVILSNAYGMATSSVVALTVVDAPTNYPYQMSLIANNPVGYWRLNETSGNIAHDYANGRNGTYTGVTLNQAGYSPANPDRSALFGPGSSINSYVAGIPVDFGTNGTANFTLETWVKASTAQTTDAGIITRGTGSGGEQFNLDTGSGSHAFRFFVRDAGGTAHLANGSVTPSTTGWQHLVGVCNESAGYVALYVNGVSNAGGTITAGSGLLMSTNAMTIGSRQSGTTSYDNQFRGWIDEVVIYRYAMSAAQVQSHYLVRTNAAPGFPSNPFTRPAAQAGVAYNSTLVGTAVDPNNGALSFLKLDGPTWLEVATDGVLTGTAVSADVGTNTFTVRATDITGLTADATMSLNVTAAAPIQLTSGIDGANFSFSWAGGAGLYQIEMTTNLANPIWIPVGDPTAAANIVIPLTNQAAFFRVMGQ